MPVTSPVPNAPLSTTADVKAWLELFYTGLNADRVLDLYAADAR